MFASGLIKPYPVKRPLTQEERGRQLKQQEHINLEPADQLSVIKVNSTYLEVVDKFYDYKGWFTMVAVLVPMAVLGLLAYLTIDSFGEPGTWDATIFALIVTTPLYLLCYWGFRKESCRYTHWPVRFNRKTRMVHVFLMDGRQASVPWKDVFFEVAPGFMPGDNDSWDLRGHILKRDGKTVIATFGIMSPNVGEEGREVVIRQWEFIRRYMEEDHIAIINQVSECMPIDGKRESWEVAWTRLMSLTNVDSPAQYAFMLLVAKFGKVIQTPFRMLAMHTSKLPVWNARIEAENVIDPNDPYIKDSRINPEGLR